MDKVTGVQIQGETVWFSHCANSFGKKYESNYPPSSYELIVGQTGLFNHGIATSLGERKLWI